MKAINLFVLTRDIDSDVLSEYEYALSSRNKPIKFRLDEIDLIKTIVDIFLFRKADLSVYGGWFYSFTIPQIGKEFDLLRIGENTIINLELKNQFVDLKKIEKQLKQNRYYLSHLKKTVHSFTVIRDDNKKLRVYKFEDSLKNSSFKELIEKIQEDSFYLDSDIEDLFDPCYYLVSPISTPDRFLKHEYFLNNQQLDIKRSIMNSDPDNRLFGIKGSAGTGKTLLLYDIAFTYGKTKKTCIIHSGLLPEDYNCLNIRMDYISLIEEKSIKADILKQFDVICVDETQRLNSALIDSILEIVRNHNNKICIFSYDFAQTLSKSEIQRNTPKKLNEIHGFVEYKLTGRIRTNDEINSFIRNMLNLKIIPPVNMSFQNIDILYANNMNEADTILQFVITQGYQFITITSLQYTDNIYDHHSSGTDSHQVIGQEFDKVVVIIDSNFWYNDSGELQGNDHPNPDYLFERLIYQNITRARKKLCVIVLDNPDVFRRLLMIKNMIHKER